MDNRGTPAPSNSQIRRYFASQNTQDPSICWPFRVRYEYSDIINRLCRVHLSSRRVPENVEAPEPSAVRRNTEGENVVDENHRGTLSTIPIIISSGGEDDSGDDAAYEAAERRRKGKAAVDEISSGAELEYDRQLNVAILESLKSYNRNIVGQNLNTHALRTVTGLAGGNVGNIVNDSASNPVMELANVSHSLNEDSVDEGVQTEALDVVRGYELAVYNGNGARSESEADIGHAPRTAFGDPGASSTHDMMSLTLNDADFSFLVAGLDAKSRNEMANLPLWPMQTLSGHAPRTAFGDPGASSTHDMMSLTSNDDFSFLVAGSGVGV